MKRSAKRKQDTVEHKTRLIGLLLAAVAVAAIIFFIVLSSSRGSNGLVEIHHVHGLGFSPDGHQLFVAAHDGLRAYADGEWSVPDIPAHDYMGYSATEDGFYSSGHPNPSANRINPFGLIKSVDGGASLIRLGFEGESDFHVMTVGYRNHAIYVLNTAPNSRLPVGIHYSVDDGETWQQSALQGPTANPIQIAVHPTEANVVALATEGGLFVSFDHGGTFERVSEAGPVTAVTFSPNGEQLFFGYTTLAAYDLATKQIDSLQIPAIAADDAIGYIAINPIQPGEMAFATFGRDIYLSIDGGQSWQPIAQDGKGG